MKLSRYIERTRFTVEVLKEATETLFGKIEEGRFSHLTVGTPEGTWLHDNIEEYFADYRRTTRDDGVYEISSLSGYQLRVQSFINSGHVFVEVAAPGRAEVLTTFGVFEKHQAACALPKVPKKKPVVFIGHGGSGQWKSLKDHLSDLHKYEVEAFESGARAGHTVRDVLHSMMKSSSFALLVMTGEDATADGGVRARQNVVHEAGLFQGMLGFERAIVLLEEGVEEFSNIHGIVQIRFGKGNIREAFGDVLATLRREFPPEK